jgi:prepilin-type processing-associated H-X9-DG protein
LDASTPVAWSQVFPDTPPPDERVAVVMAWGPWSAHAADALKDMEEATHSFSTAGMNVAVFAAADPGSRLSDVSGMFARHNITLNQIPLLPANLTRTGLHNQNPSNMLFVDGQLSQKRLGPLKRGEILEWVQTNAGSTAPR